MNDSRLPETLRATSSARPGSKNGTLPSRSERHLRFVDIDAGHLVAEVGDARAGHETDIAGPDDSDLLHGMLVLTGSSKVGMKAKPRA